MCASAGLVLAKSEFALWECLTPVFAISAFEFGRVWAPALAMSAFEIIRVCGSVDCIWEWCREGSVTFQFSRQLPWQRFAASWCVHTHDRGSGQAG